MRYIFPILLLAILLLFVLTGCSANPPFSGIKNLIGFNRAELAPFVSFSFSESNTMLVNGIFSCTVYTEADKTFADIRLEGMSEEEAVTVEPDFPLMDALYAIAEKYELGKWNGFSKNNKNVLDGSSFHLSIQMENGESIHANGYMSWPDNYGAAMSEVQALCEALYYEAYPSKERTLEQYCTETVTAELGAVTDKEISYGYVSAGDHSYAYTDLNGEREGVLGHVVMDIDRDGSEELIVIYQKKTQPEDADRIMPAWQLRLRVYTIDDDLAITLAGDVLFDADLYWNDSQYSFPFLYDLPDDAGMLIGFSSRQSFDAGSQEAYYYLVLYSLKDGALELAADEYAFGPMDRSAWKHEDIADIFAAAEKYGMSASLAHWQDMPGDPSVSTLDAAYQFFTIMTSSSWDSGFYDALGATETGNPVQGYEIDGKIF